MIRLALVLALAPATAGAFSIDWPVDCTLGDTCRIQQYMDRDPGPGFTDFTCGPLSYDTHSGTDIALPSLAAMQKGVSVRAAADGVVKGMRDGMADISIRDPNAPDIQGRECGNGLVIDHGDGWETQYCHMAKGSLLHQKGDRVSAGDPLGIIGLSGNTEFPHLHLSVRHNGVEIDPFDPDGLSSCGQGPEDALWTTSIPYQPGGLISMGLAAEVPTWDAIRAGLPIALPGDNAPALVVWAHYFGNRAGDTLRLSIIAPNGDPVIEKDLTLDRPQAQAFRAIGRKQNVAVAPGPYKINATLIRNGQIVDSRSDTIILP